MEVEMDMYRRLIFLPLILLIISLACSQIPSQLPASTRTNPTVLDSTSTPISVITTPGGEIAVLPTHTSLTPAIDLTPTPLPQEDLPTSSDQIVSSETASAWYALQPGSPIAMSNIFHPELGCNWMGVGGQVFAESGQPVGMLVVELGGSLNGREVSGLTLTGSANQWGPGGYEFQIDNQPIATQGELWLRILNLEGEPLSDRIYIDTYEDCTQSAIIANFIFYTAPTYEVLYFPVIIQDQD